ncbi:MAG TPA: valine--tRNA ligase [Spirochaetia bacterium]|nr:MAG: valine--tRNA ligase [Spirochaetes bacterium GWB1_36_13]HCL56541.1 valine--tRNA ligase [Spirochaetia bacterium]
MEPLNTKYSPEEIEEKWYSFWEKNGYFHPQPDQSKEPFTIVIPPPNVTSVLHMGHGLNNTIQDVVIRYKKMCGFNTLWIPGTDHAGIATQNVVEKMLAKEGKTRQDLGREEFLKKVWEWKEKYGNAIIHQLKKIGSACDWERARFTMDEGLSEAVRETFVRLYEDNLIYKGEYIINWCPRCTTALSDEEAEHQSESGHLFHIKYKLKDSEDYLVVATVRPETLLGDTAVAVHPEDERYQKYIGKTVILPLSGKEIPVIGDTYVEKEFGTGVLKITPAHDPNDFEIGRKHGLPIVNLLNPDGTMNENALKYKGMDRFDCRKQIIKDLKEEQLLLKQEDYQKSVGHCYRCDSVVEPYVSTQWFVKMKPLAEKAKQVVETGEVDLIPDQWKKVYINWMDNIRDWCISRQIWWGHRIPVWYCEDCGKMMVKRHDPDQCEKCGSKKIRQDEDVLDTWFSSWLWPISTLGWPSETEDLSYFYPTQFLSTAPEILFFWVARMVMAGLYFKGKVPFSKVYLHSTVCDANGKKMSKSLGNGIDPLEVVEKYGADSLRFTVLYLAPIGQRIRLSNESFEIGYRFSNKLWNASRFIFMNTGSCEISPVEKLNLNDWDKWILESLNQVTEKVRADLENYRFNDVTDSLYHFIWNKLCDWYLEVSKIRIYSKDQNEKNAVASVLYFVLEKTLKLLHPVMPFITEEIWQKLPNKKGDSIMLSDFPEKMDLQFESVSVKIDTLQEVIYHVRNIRGDMNVTPDKKVNIILSTVNEDKMSLFQAHINAVQTLAKVDEIVFQAGGEKPEKTVSAVGNQFEVFVRLEGLVDYDKEIERIEKEIAKTEKDLNFSLKKLENKEFVDKAPQAIVEKEKQKQQELSDKIAKLKELAQKFGK